MSVERDGHRNGRTIAWIAVLVTVAIVTVGVLIREVWDVKAESEKMRDRTLNTELDLRTVITKLDNITKQLEQVNIRLERIEQRGERKGNE